MTSEAQEAHALYEYKPADGIAGHLHLQRGDVVSVNVAAQQYPEWWNGMLLHSGSVGMFPRSYVELIDKSGAFNVRALYNFAGEQEGTLNMQAGDEVVVVKTGEGWWFGTRGGRYGMFPSNYVEKIVATPQLPPALPPPTASVTAVAVAVTTSSTVNSNNFPPPPTSVAAAATMTSTQAPAARAMKRSMSTQAIDTSKTSVTPTPPPPSGPNPNLASAARLVATTLASKSGAESLAIAATAGVIGKAGSMTRKDSTTPPPPLPADDRTTSPVGTAKPLPPPGRKVGSMDASNAARIAASAGDDDGSVPPPPPPSSSSVGSGGGSGSNKTPLPPPGRRPGTMDSATSAKASSVVAAGGGGGTKLVGVGAGTFSIPVRLIDRFVIRFFLGNNVLRRQ